MQRKNNLALHRRTIDGPIHHLQRFGEAPHLILFMVIKLLSLSRKCTLGSNPLLQPYAVLKYRIKRVLRLELLEGKISAAAHNLLLITTNDINSSNNNNK
jgi:hypothetical protein